MPNLYIKTSVWKGLTPDKEKKKSIDYVVFQLRDMRGQCITDTYSVISTSHAKSAIEPVVGSTIT